MCIYASEGRVYLILRLKVTAMVELVGAQDTFKALKAYVFKLSPKKR